MSTRRTKSEVVRVPTDIIDRIESKVARRWGHPADKRALARTMFAYGIALALEAPEWALAYAEQPFPLYHEAWRPWAQRFVQENPIEIPLADSQPRG